MPRRLVERAQIVLGSAEGRPAHVISEEVGMTRLTVQRWLDRYEADGLAGIEEDRPRSGRPRRITDDVEAEVIRKTLAGRRGELKGGGAFPVRATRGVHMA